MSTEAGFMNVRDRSFERNLLLPSNAETYPRKLQAIAWEAENFVSAAHLLCVLGRP